NVRFTPKSGHWRILVEFNCRFISPRLDLQRMTTSPDNAARIRRGRKIAAGVAFNSEPIASFGWDELDHDIVGDHMHGKAVDLRDGAAKRFRWCGAGICGKRRHHGSDETDAAGTKRTGQE